LTVVSKGTPSAGSRPHLQLSAAARVLWVLPWVLGAATLCSAQQAQAAPAHAVPANAPPAIAAPAGQAQPAQQETPAGALPETGVQVQGTAQDTTQGTAQAPSPAPSTTQGITPATTKGIEALAGQKVLDIQFKGVSPDLLQPLPPQLPLQKGDVLDPNKVRDTLRRLFQTGLYQTIQVEAIRLNDGIIVIFSGEPKLFLGRTEIYGVKNDRLRTQLLASTRLSPGTRFSTAKVDASQQSLTQALKENGYYKGTITRRLQLDLPNSQVNVLYDIEPGEVARVGAVEVQGNPGMTLEQFRKTGKLKENSKVSRKTVNRALSRLRKTYQKKSRWAGNVTLLSSQYQPSTNVLNYKFNAVEGPVVNVKVEGARLSKAKVRQLVPIYEEGAVDLDLINEGAHNIRSYLQGKGYFDATVTHEPVHNTADEVTALYNVQQGREHQVDSVKVVGNKYFDDETIQEHISVRPANFIERHGTFSQALVDSDADNLTSLYQGNGFSHVKVTPEIRDSEENGETGKHKVAHLMVVYRIEEGQQQKIGDYAITGAEKVSPASLRPLLNTQVGQPYSSINITGDRDVVLGYYLSRGYQNVQVNVVQGTDPKNPALVDVKMNIVEGEQFFVNKVLLSGLHYTRPSVVEDRITVRPGQPIDQSALLDTQRKLYNLALFNEVTTAIQNPNGNQQHKNVLVQTSEAKRWDLTYGFGFQAQTGTPFRNQPSAAELIQLGINPSTYSSSPNGHFGVSPDVLLDISRINLRGTNQSVTLRTGYGTLEQQAIVVYQNPGILRNPNLSASISGGYTSSQNVTTYSASSLGASLRVSQHVTKPTTLIYSFSYREVRVNPNSIQVSLALIPLLSQPARIGGPGLQYIRDTRDDPLDAHHGTFNTMTAFFANSKFGSQSNFGRIDLTNATYYDFGKRHWVFARETRYGQERSFGSAKQEFVPLPERLYAGGATSHRGFSINAAGPRDPQTGFPIGGFAAFINSFELRTPYPNLPLVGNNLGFVLFHDMGNVFDKSSNVFPSFLRFHQPNESSCRTIPLVNTNPNGSINTPLTACSFNYFSHAIGLGARYHTPIGPLRVDSSYNLNPPYFPEVYNYQTSNSATPQPQIGQANHFNFFFSIGQTF
jgi:outer membrane protein insertion porin family